jgi:transketolase
MGTPRADLLMDVAVGRNLELRSFSDRLRLSVVRLHQSAGAGHLGSALSIIEALAVIFLRHFRWSAEGEPPWSGDRLVLSKGHAAMALYCALALQGKIATERLLTFGRSGSPLEPHPNEVTEPAIQASTGSLGQGLSIGVGLALGSRLRKAPDRTYVIVGDGELNEGQIWEAARCAAKLKLSNLIVLLDDNGMQQDGPTADIMPVSDALQAWSGMGWACLECDGHDCDALSKALDLVARLRVDAPQLLRIMTVKGWGVGSLEGRTESHFPAPVGEEEIALMQYARGNAPG